MRQLLILAVALAMGCSPKGGSDKPKATPTRCTQFGETCEFAPGKLGVCVAPDGCTTSSCLVCQSQH